MDRPEPGSSEQEYREWIEESGKLTDQQRAEIEKCTSEMFPFRDGANPKEIAEVDERVAWALGDFVRARNFGVDKYSKQEVRKEAAQELKQLLESTSSEAEFLSGFGDLGDLATWAVKGADRNEGASYSVDKALRYIEPDASASLPTARPSSSSLRYAAKEAVRILEPAGKSGRKYDISAAALSADLQHIKEKFAGSRPFKRGSERNKEIKSGPVWAFRDFVVKIGRIVDPDFNDGALRRLRENVRRLKKNDPRGAEFDSALSRIIEADLQDV
jgi:hypothetical protein